MSSSAVMAPPREAEEHSPEAVAPPPGNPRFPLFDGLRAVAALAVLIFHVAAVSEASTGEAGLSPYLARLNVGVAVFFVISGFLLYRPLLAARVGDGPPIRLRDYARRRVLRIVPAYWVALTVLALYPGLLGLFGHGWWVYYVFGQDYSHNTEILGIGPAWSLGCEVVFYALLPFISLALAWLSALRGRQLWWQLEVAVIGGLAVASAAWRAYVDVHPSVPPNTFAATFAWFAAGMLLAVASVSWHRRPAGPLRLIARYAWAGWVLAAAAYVGICRGLGLSGAGVFAPVTRMQDLAVYALSGVVALGLALPAAFEATARSLPGRFLATPIMAWLGLISYGIFLYHSPLAFKLSGGVSSGGNATLKFLWLAPATLAVAITAGALSYYLVERPALRFKDRRRARAVPVARVAG
ncbi:MAG TPA: acyltransferase [Solirubrobacteraceae bacterium]|nr:acyltransferase [Solirubrobacteraceae bacterium]